MIPHRVTSSAFIEAPAKQIYTIIADYRDGHPQILLKPQFGPLVVERGGIGGGTVISFQMRILSRLRTFHAAVTEPSPDACW